MILYVGSWRQLASTTVNTRAPLYISCFKNLLWGVIPYYTPSGGRVSWTKYKFLNSNRNYLTDYLYVRGSNQALSSKIFPLLSINIIFLTYVIYYLPITLLIGEIPWVKAKHFNPRSTPRLFIIRITETLFLFFIFSPLLLILWQTPAAKIQRPRAKRALENISEIH